MGSNDYNSLIDPAAANLLELHAVILSILVISVTSDSAIRFKAMLCEVRIRSRHGESLFQSMGMLPACRIKQLLGYRKLEAYAT